MKINFGNYVEFFPVLLVWPIWFYTVSNEDLWFDIFSQYWPATIGMIFGSFIAGSTPLGGGVVAFPIGVLILGFTSQESRDASVLVQSVGMNAASFLLFTTKRYLLNFELICINIVFGIIGMLIGLKSNESSELTNLIYTVSVFGFGIIYFYSNVFNKDENKNNRDITRVDSVSHIHVVGARNQSSVGIGTDIIDGKLGGKPDGKRDTRYKTYLVYTLMCAFATVGGFLTASVGSGSDIMVFVFGVYVWNNIYNDNKFDENVLTASSVVIMGVLSFATTTTRVLSSDPITNHVILCWAAMAFIVVLGAPVGSLVLKPSNIIYLQYLFYLLSLVQFILFGILKIKTNSTVWIIIGCIIFTLLILLSLHYFCVKNTSQSKNENTNKNNSKSTSTMLQDDKMAVIISGDVGVEKAASAEIHQGVEPKLSFLKSKELE